MLLLGLILLVVGVLVALLSHREAGVAVAIVGGVLALYALLAGGRL